MVVIATFLWPLSKINYLYMGALVVNLTIANPIIVFLMALARNLVFVILLTLTVLLRGVNNIDIPKPFVPGLVRRHGAFVQKWEGVDDVKIDKLLEDSRYPYMPTWSGYLSNFAQPSNWGDNYGARIRTYFVPLQTGYHVFYLQSNNEGRLYMSPDVNEHHKSLIAQVSDIHFTSATDFSKYDEQKSFPILLQKGNYYYMECLMKEKFNADVMDVAVKTPDGEMHVPITSEFLWTSVGNTVTTSSTSQHFLWRLTARTAARFGYAAGQSSGAIKGAKAGAKAGLIAGKEYGTKIGAEVGRNIAKNIMTNAITLALKADPRSSGGVVNLFTNTKANVVDNGAHTAQLTTDPSSLIGSILGNIGGTGAGTGPGGGARTGTSGTGTSGTGTSGTGTAGAGTATSTAGVGASAGAVAAGASSAASSSSSGESQPSSNSVSSSSARNSSSSSNSTNQITSVDVSSSYGPQSQKFSGKNQAETIVTPFLPLNPDERVTPSGFINPKYEIKQASLDTAQIVVKANPAEDPNVKARQAVNNEGFASKVLKRGFYKIMSMNHPAKQTNNSRNLCFQSVESKISLTSFCHVFKVMDGFSIYETQGKQTVSFESACVPGYYLRQKNYKFVLAQKEKSYAFDNSATFRLFRSISYPTALQINAVVRHDNPHLYDWFICEDPKTDYSQTSHGLRIFAQMEISRHKLAEKCSFHLQPIGANENSLQNCKNVLDVSKPKLPGHKRKDNSKSLERKAKNDLCVAVNFINKAGIPFELQSDLNDEPFLIKQGNLRFKDVVKIPELHRLVIFRASDPTNKNMVLLSGGKEITVTPLPDCDDEDNYLDVLVSSKPNPKASNVEKPPQVVTPVHHHYHYHPPLPPPPQPSVCPSICTTGPVCPSTCSQICCKKDEVTYVQAKSKIGRIPNSKWEIK